MQVSPISSHKVKITLTDTEVLSCFGAYEKLFSMSETSKSLIKALLRDVAAEYRLTSNESLTAKIHAVPKKGCTIILSVPNSGSDNYYTAVFYSSESLIQSALCLKKIKRKIKKSLLYRINDSYRLLIKSPLEQEHFIPLYEFCDKLYSGSIHFEYTKEYGKPLIKDNALQTITSCFIKDF